MRPAPAQGCGVGAPLVKPGGRLVYVTCSVLWPENRGQVDDFLARHADFKLVPWRALWEAAVPVAPPPSADGSEETLLMTPLSHGTDGFFAVSYTHLRAHETRHDLVCRLLL